MTNNNSGFNYKDDKFDHMLGKWAIEFIETAMLYHYSSINNLKSIIENKQFFVTRSDFLNDPNEVTYFNELLQHTIKEYRNNYSEELINSIIDIFERNKDLMPTSVYVLSLSKNPDSLSMWNYYGKNDGYNLGLNPKALINVIKNQGITSMYGNVNYDYFSQMEVISNELSLANDAWEKHRKGQTVDDKFLSRLVIALFRRWSFYSLFFKHKGYINEEEYRFVFYNSKKNETRVKYRVSHGVIVPYIEVNIGVDKRFPLEKICIGPYIKHDKPSAGLELWLKSLGHELKFTPDNSGEICQSNIPIRF